MLTGRTNGRVLTAHWRSSGELIRSNWQQTSLAAFKPEIWLELTAIRLRRLLQQPKALWRNPASR